jgi:xylan 1,4-beta-xylosidase
VDGKLQSVSGAEMATPFRVVDQRRGRIALRGAGGQFVSVGAEGKVVTLRAGKPGDAETFQWVDLQHGEILLLSLATHRHIIAPKTPGAVAADHPGPAPDRRDGSCFSWKASRR